MYTYDKSLCNPLMNINNINKEYCVGCRINVYHIPTNNSTIYVFVVL